MGKLKYKKSVILMFWICVISRMMILLWNDGGRLLDY